ncbi:MAG: aminotransferase class I/II-fold pyridoxal phosphate-dependent enzyme, partial [Chloroflexi bacterium]|nr:aminotransferase class I/II-fold pyridoxal phosphate-dependent enzyme [Chloroflexota bacterium]
MSLSFPVPCGICNLSQDFPAKILVGTITRLGGDGHRPKPAEVYSRSGRVLTCGSFSKTAAPGYRIGWLLAGQYRDVIMRLKRSYSCSSGLLQQLTLTEFLASGDYDRYLKTLRPVLQQNAQRTSALVAQHFPA